MSTSFGELVATWLNTVAAVELKPSGYKSYEGVCRLHLLPWSGDLPLDAIDADRVQSYVANKVAAGLSPRTVANHVQLLRRLMDFAVGRSLIEVSPLSSVSSPRQEPAASRVRYLTPEQLHRLIEEATPAAWKILVAMAAMLGLRKGEQLALSFNDIDFEKRTVSISKTIKQGVISSPKTPWSIGVLPLPESLIPLLEERREKAPDRDGLIFCRRDGSPLPDGLPNRILARALQAAGLPSVTWHEMGRHSWVVAHLQAGTDIPTLQRLGRWKTADVLLSTYAHVLPASGSQAMQRLDELLG